MTTEAVKVNGGYMTCCVTVQFNLLRSYALWLMGGQDIGLCSNAYIRIIIITPIRVIYYHVAIPLVCWHPGSMFWSIPSIASVRLLRTEVCRNLIRASTAVCPFFHMTPECSMPHTCMHTHTHTHVRTHTGPLPTSTLCVSLRQV